MPYSEKGYSARAEECVRLANQAKDSMIQAELLKLRQVYLQIAKRLSRLGAEAQTRTPESNH
jgi:hypothetical protein